MASASPECRIHNRLLYTTIAIDYLQPSNSMSADRFRGRCREYLTDPASRSVTDISELLSLLEARGYIKIGDYTHLKNIVDFDIRILQEIKKAEREIQNHDRQHIYNRRATENDDRARTAAGKVTFMLRELTFIPYQTRSKNV